MTDMTENWVAGFEQAPAPESVSCLISRCPTSSSTRSRQRNVFHLLALREVSPRTKHRAKKHWNKSLRCDPRHDLFSWLESQSLHRWSAKYCPLVPPPRSTIAAAFSPDGRTLASTHGDHTVKIIDYQTGKCLKELIGHQRTPWVVRYHPVYSDIVASGSLDHEVRLWDAKTSHCIGAHHFYRPIASIAFHANGKLLAVASGHKLFIWDYSKRGEDFNPPMVLKTRRSLRAVHFHPHGAPYLLTAEVNNLDLGDSTLTLATSSGYSNCRPAVIVANSSSMSCPHLKSRVFIQPIIGSEVPTSLFDSSGAELPCTVKLKIWRHDIKYPYATLHPVACCLTISHAVLCSEMGTHFSPCGRFLVACVACLLPQTEGDHGTQLPMNYNSTGAGTSPTRHPLSSHQVIYELRVYSLEKATFGTVVASRAIKAAHCLTSIQFSPTSEHILLAYGRRHNSLLRTIFLDGRTIVPVYTVLEVYRVSDMELVRVLPSALDEVNVACFHPSPGAGLVYGTKEGKLRILQPNGANSGPDFFAEQNMLEELP
ncbi:hypothetical protein QOZ80_6AG0520790 [Eleusine coracana subsp. coracana]|nr:hypothetical protein QOZ80_6AG0520790 [Eleusine coracana subsp. coracana]